MSPVVAPMGASEVSAMLSLARPPFAAWHSAFLAARLIAGWF